MNKETLKNAIDNIDADLVSEARDFKAQTGRGKGAGSPIFKIVAVAAVFLIFVTAGIAAAMLISGSGSQNKKTNGQNDETLIGQTGRPEDGQATNSTEPKVTPGQTDHPAVTPPHEEVVREETYKIEVMSGKLRFSVIACTPWYIADVDYGLEYCVPGRELGAGRYTLGASEVLKHTLFDILDGKDVIEFNYPNRPLVAIEARYSENETDFNYVFCLYENAKALTVIDLNKGQEICSVALTEEEVAAIIECVMPELRTLASARLFELRNIDHIDHIDVSSRPFAPDYSGKIESDEEIGLIMSSLFDLHALETAGESLYGMAWVLDIYYRDGETDRIYLVCSREVRTSDGDWYRVAYKEKSELEELIRNLISAK